MFRLLGNVTTAAPETSERKRRTMLEQIASGERDQSVLGQPSPPTVRRWRSLAVLRLDLIAEWHPTSNGELDPYRIGQHTHRKVWWRCSECSHEWQASPNERTSAGRGCPACGRRRSIAATVDRNRRFRVSRERSIAVVRPDLLEEWHPALNGVLDPFTVAAGSERRVWWQCSTEDCRREWQAVVGDRAKRGLGCPACGYRRGGERRSLAERDRSLGALHPRLLAEWHPTRNGDLDPYAIKPGSQAQSADYGGAALIAGATGRRPRCRAGTARAAAAQPARSGWHGEPSSSGQRRRRRYECFACAATPDSSDSPTGSRPMTTGSRRSRRRSRAAHRSSRARTTLTQHHTGGPASSQVARYQALDLPDACAGEHGSTGPDGAPGARAHGPYPRRVFLDAPFATADSGRLRRQKDHRDGDSALRVALGARATSWSSFPASKVVPSFRARSAARHRPPALGLCRTVVPRGRAAIPRVVRVRRCRHPPQRDGRHSPV
jgi:DNA-directed RNA polymerase subunit RPC12/RpoP